MVKLSLDGYQAPYSYRCYYNYESVVVKSPSATLNDDMVLSATQTLTINLHDKIKSWAEIEDRLEMIAMKFHDPRFRLVVMRLPVEEMREKAKEVVKPIYEWQRVEIS